MKDINPEMDPFPASFRRILSRKIIDSLENPLPDFTPRKLSGRIFVPGKVSSVIGVRRSGKTTFVHQMRKTCLNEGFQRNRLPYVNFEDERLGGLSAKHLSFLIEEYYRLYPEYRHKETVFWSFDEIQVVNGWERFVRRVMDEENVRIMITGSSASLLSREIATSLRGRAWTILIHPFSFSETLKHRGFDTPSKERIPGSGEKSMLEKAMSEYLRIGGFPEAQELEAEDRNKLLKDYVDVALFRDVVERYSITNIAGLRWMIRHLLGNPASLFSAGKFYNAMRTQGFSIAKDTVHQLLDYLEDCFLVRLVWIEASSERQRMVNPRKVYPVDTGLIPLFDTSGKSNIGHALESTVFLELERRGYEVSYVRTESGYELDFLAKAPGGRQELIQVCADAEDTLTLQRELRALREAASMFPKAKKIIITLNEETALTENDQDVRILPAHQWFLYQ